MNELTKLYENAGVELNEGLEWVCKNPDHCIYQNLSIVPENCSGCEYFRREMVYPPFTAEKQLEIMKVITTNHISDDYEYKYLGIDRDEIDREFYLNLCIDGSKYHAHDKDFTVALVKLVNLIWQDLTDAERTQIKEILE